MSCDNPIVTNGHPNAQEQDGFPQAPEATDAKMRFSIDEPDLAANRTYIANLPPIADRVECARTYLASIDPNSGSWKCEPQSLAAHRVVHDFAVDPRYAWDL